MTVANPQTAIRTLTSLPLGLELARDACLFSSHAMRRCHGAILTRARK